MTMSQAARRILPQREGHRRAEPRAVARRCALGDGGLPGPYAVFAPDGEVVAVVVERQGRARPEVVLAPAR